MYERWLWDYREMTVIWHWDDCDMTVYLLCDSSSPDEVMFIGFHKKLSVSEWVWVWVNSQDRELPSGLKKCIGLCEAFKNFILCYAFEKCEVSKAFGKMWCDRSTWTNVFLCKAIEKNVYCVKHLSLTKIMHIRW